MFLIGSPPISESEPIKSLISVVLNLTDFINEEKSLDLVEKWSKYWPQTGNPPNWDAIGKGDKESEKTWILVEAKGHLKECESDCKAVQKSQVIIDKAFSETISSACFKGEGKINKWKKKYYQYANRLAVLNFLRANDVPAILLFVYFIGDKNGSFTCPQSQAIWEKKIIEIHNHLEIDEGTRLMERVFHLFLPIHPHLSFS